VARVEEIGNSEVLTSEIEARVRLLQERAREAMQLLPNLPAELRATIESLDSPSALADFVAGIMDSKPSEKQDILETLDIKERLDKVLVLLAQRIRFLSCQRRSASRPSSHSPRSSASISCASSCARSRRSWVRATTRQLRSPSCAA
jgi:ATP-dependent Lon protease